MRPCKHGKMIFPNVAYYLGVIFSVFQRDRRQSGGEGNGGRSKEKLSDAEAAWAGSLGRM